MGATRTFRSATPGLEAHPVNQKAELPAVRPDWGGWALRTVLFGTVYLLVTGLVILLAPFGTGAQWCVLLHTAGGILFLVPFGAYLWPHFLARWRDKLSHLLLLGYMAGLLLLLVVASGVVVTVEALFGRRVSYGWDLVHIVTGCAVGAIIVAHMLTAVRRAHRGEGRFVARLLLGAGVAGTLLAVATWGGGGLFPGPSAREPLPEGYGYRYGENPFAPSLARSDWLWRLEKDRSFETLLADLAADPAQATAERMAGFLEVAERQLAMDEACARNGERHVEALGRLDADARRIAGLRALAAAPAADRGPRIEALLADVRADVARSRAALEERGGIRPEALAGSRSCGAAGCHEEILAEWEPSAHRYASRSAFFQLIQGAMAESNGAESTRYCAGCHDPISLFSGAKNIFKDDLSTPGADEGISCAVCHSIVQTDVQGNANYVLAPPERYLAEEGFVGRFLIRAYPRPHKASYGRPLMQTAEYCGACHKQFIDEQLNRSTRVQLQNQYDAWRGSHWFVPDPRNPARSDPRKALACRDCHMRLAASGEPAAEGKHRHHGFIAANQWLPLLHDLPHAERHVALTEQWLKGETVIPEIADRWPPGPPIPLVIEAPATAKPGEKVRIRVVADNRKVGHTFPTGPLDVIQSWVEVRATEGRREIFRSGDLDENGFIRTGSWMFKAEGVDRAGNLIDRHNLWDMVGSRFRRVLFPGFSDREEYTFECACSGETPIAGSEVELAVGEDAEEIVVEAVLHYRKVDQTLLNVLLPDGKARAPVTDMSRATARIRVDRAP
jgi:hypothetical protein